MVSANGVQSLIGEGGNKGVEKSTGKKGDIRQDGGGGGLLK